MRVKSTVNAIGETRLGDVLGVGVGVDLRLDLGSLEVRVVLSFGESGLVVDGALHAEFRLGFLWPDDVVSDMVDEVRSCAFL